MTTVIDIRCINKDGAIRWIPQQLANDPAYRRRHGLTIQDLTIEKQEVEDDLFKEENKLLESVELPKEKGKPGPKKKVIIEDEGDGLLPLQD